MFKHLLRLLLVCNCSSYMLYADGVMQGPKHETEADIFKRQVDSSLVAKEFILKKIGIIHVKNAAVRVFLYESTFGKARRVTRRLAFIDDKNRFLGMYGNFSEVALSITDNCIQFEADPVYVDEPSICIPSDGIPNELRFRGEIFQLFGCTKK